MEGFQNVLEDRTMRFQLMRSKLIRKSSFRSQLDESMSLRWRMTAKSIVGVRMILGNLGLDTSINSEESYFPTKFRPWQTLSRCMLEGTQVWQYHQMVIYLHGVIHEIYSQLMKLLIYQFQLSFLMFLVDEKKLLKALFKWISHKD